MLCSLFGCKASADRFQSVSVKKFEQCIADTNVVRLDVRTIDEFEEGHIAGAALDVYDCEPPLPVDCELFNAPNLLMLPHIGYATREAFGIRFGIVVRNIEMWLAGTPQNKIC